MRRYEAGDVAGALTSMRESYRLSARPELLYNIARLEKELGDCAPALADYREYVERAPQGRYRADASSAIDELSARCPPSHPALKGAPAGGAPAGNAAISTPPALDPSQPPAPAPAAESPAPPTHVPRLPESTATRASSYWTPQRWIGWSMIGAGAITEAVALGFLTAALDERDRFKASVDTARSQGLPPDFGLEDAQHRDQHWAQLLGVTGGALVAGGALLVLFAPDRSPASPTSARLHVQPGLLSIGFSGSF
jgi:hypothetical protein